MRIEDLSVENQKKLDRCVRQIKRSVDKYFPEIRKSWDNFDERIYMTMYLELIHAGVFKRIKKTEYRDF